MKNIKTAILGIHHPTIVDSLKLVLDSLDYKVLVSKSDDDMINTMEEENLPRNGKGSFQDLYIMDVNLGYPNSSSIEPGIKIHERVKSSVQNGYSKFISFTGNLDALKKANDAGLPCMKNADFNIYDFIEE